MKCILLKRLVIKNIKLFGVRLVCYFVCPKSKKDKENCFKGKRSKTEIILETVDVFVSAVSIKGFGFLFLKSNIIVQFSFVLFDFAFVMTVISLDIINW